MILNTIFSSLCKFTSHFSFELVLFYFRFAVKQGYWKDPYIQFLVKAGNRKAPEINRGRVGLGPWPSFIELLQQNMLLKKSQLSNNEQDTTIHK